jgi:hypothetical protein
MPILVVMYIFAVRMGTPNVNTTTNIGMCDLRIILLPVAAPRECLSWWRCMYSGPVSSAKLVNVGDCTTKNGIENFTSPLSSILAKSDSWLTLTIVPTPAVEESMEKASMFFAFVNLFFSFKTFFRKVTLSSSACFSRASFSFFSAIAFRRLTTFMTSAAADFNEEPSCPISER